jgi:hypothetical protein
MSFIRYPKQKDFQLKDREEDYSPPPLQPQRKNPLEKNAGGGSGATIVLVPKTPIQKTPSAPRPPVIPKVANSVVRVPKTAVVEIEPPAPLPKEPSIQEIKEEIVPETIRGNFSLSDSLIIILNCVND